MENFTAPGIYAPSILPPGFAAAQPIAVYRVASAGYATTTADDPASTVYEPRLLDDIDVSQTAYDAIGLGGRVALTVSNFRLWDGDRQLAALVSRGTADGRAIVIRTAAVTDPVATNFGTALGSTMVAFSGIVRRVEHTAEQYVTVQMGDAADRLAVPLQVNRFAGTGGVEGASEVAGRPKPVCLGTAFNLEPVAIGNHDLGDGALPTYAVNWRAVSAITGVRIRAVAQSSVGTAPGVGEYRPWLSLGVFQLGSTADGPIRADVAGDADPDFADSTTAIIRRLLTSLGPVYDEADLDTQAFDFAETDLADGVGWYHGADEISAADAVDEILAGSGAVLAGGRNGTLRLFDPLAAGESQWTLSDAHILAIEPLPLPGQLRPLPATVAIEYARNWSPLTDVAGSVSDDLRSLYQQPASGPERESSTTIGTNVRQAREMRLRGLYDTSADATARAARWIEFLEANPRGFRITTDRYLGQMECGDVGQFSYPAFGLDLGASGVVVGWREQLSARRLQLDVITSPFITVGANDIDADFVAPVSSGLLGWWYLGETVADTEHDRAGIADATLVGSPSFGGGYVSFTGAASGQWLQTQVTEQTAFTCLVVGRSFDTFAAAGQQPWFVSNVGADAGNGGATLGCGIYINGGTSPAGTVRGAGGHNNAGALSVENNTTFSTTDVTAWNFYAVRFEDIDSNTAATNNPRKLYNKTTAQTASTNNRPRVAHSLNKMRIGASVSTFWDGNCDVAFAAFYSGALSDADVTLIYTAVQSRLSSRHGIVI